jgi:TetR/AcrR family transcriptional regulator, tetracycline repressor protein
MTAKSRKPGRPRTGEGALTRERVLRTALAFLDREGGESLSMRRLAAELNVDPMAIYHHVSGKDALIAGVVELMFAELRLPDTATGFWQDQIRSIAHAYRALAAAHPNLVIYMATNPEVDTALSRPVNEALYAALLSANIPPRTAFHAVNLLVDFLNGYALGESTGQLADGSEREGRRLLLEEELGTQFPATQEIMRQVAVQDLRANFDAELDLVLAGIQVQSPGTA